MNNSADREKFLNRALVMSRELLHAGSQGIENEKTSEQANFCLEAGMSMLRLVHIVTKPDGELIALRESVDEYAEALARANAQLSDMARDANDASTREETLRGQVDAYRTEYLGMTRAKEDAESRLQLAESRVAELEEILDDAERTADSLRRERSELRTSYGKVINERDDALLRLERTKRDIDKLIARYS